MAPDRTVVKRGEERSLTARGKGDPMKLVRLEFAQHPRPPQRELRQRGVFDSGAASSVTWPTSTWTMMGTTASWT
jgi:hypothetical protein